MAKSTKKSPSYPRYADKKAKSKKSPFSPQAPLNVILCSKAGSKLASAGSSKYRNKNSSTSKAGAKLGSTSCKTAHRKKK